MRSGEETGGLIEGYILAFGGRKYTQVSVSGELVLDTDLLTTFVPPSSVSSSSVYS
jgi:hypothetical protein